LTFGKIDRAGTQRVEATSEPSEQCIRFQQSGAGRCELDGERQTIEATADLRNGERVIVGQGEVITDGLGSIDEQLDGGQRGQLLDRCPARERRHRQRAHRVIALGPKPKHGAARCEDLEPGAAGQQLVEVGRDVNDLLEVVQHEQGGRFRELLDQDVQRRAHALDDHARRGGDARQHQLGLSDGLERYEHRPPRVAIVQLLAHRDRQPRLADAAGSGEGDQPDLRLREQFRDLDDVLLAPDQRRRRHRQ
jgi:hypothetical protein